MKTIFLLAITIVFASFKAPTNYTINPVKSKLKWTGHAGAGAYSPSGSINIKSGTVALNGNMPVSAFMVIDMASIGHENKDLENHLKNTDFFDCGKFPEATFKLNTINGTTATGDLTIKGVTKPITFPIKVQKQDKQLMIQANLKVDRTLYGIKYNSSSFFQDLGSYAIKNEFDMDITLVADAL